MRAKVETESPVSETAQVAPDSLQLRKALGPVMLWGLGVGYVISGEYFGWNLGLPVGGTYGLLFALALVTVMYVTFVFSYTELACAIPRAGGVFVYAARGLGLGAGFLGGVAQIVEFVFAPPAIAMAIGAYVANWHWTGIDDPRYVAVASLVVFTALNIWGVKQTAVVELVVTILAVGELLLFTGIVAPHFQAAQFTANAWPNGWTGALAAIPFAIWFYLAIEGVANAAEEAKNPQRDVVIGFGAAMLTLVVLACGVFFGAVGVGGWERVVFPAENLAVGAPGSAVLVLDATKTSDSPLPLALAQVVDRGHALYQLLIGIGLLGLIASLNGIILVAGRALLEMGRVGFLPSLIGGVHARTRTPVPALLLNLLIGLPAICFLNTGALITMSAMGAVTLYIVAMAALVGLRRKEPHLARPFRAPLYPVFPAVAAAIAAMSLATMSYFNFEGASSLARSITAWYFGLLAIAYAYYWFVVRRRLSNDDIAHFYRLG